MDSYIHVPTMIQFCRIEITWYQWYVYPTLCCSCILYFYANHFLSKWWHYLVGSTSLQVTLSRWSFPALFELLSPEVDLFCKFTIILLESKQRALFYYLYFIIWSHCCFSGHGTGSKFEQTLNQIMQRNFLNYPFFTTSSSHCYLKIDWFPCTGCISRSSISCKIFVKTPIAYWFCVTLKSLFGRKTF